MTLSTRHVLSPFVPLTPLRARRALLEALVVAGAAPVARSWALCAPPATPEDMLPRPSGRVLQVRPGDARLSLSATARSARDGDTIEVEAGDYLGDVSSWPQTDLTIRGTGGRPRIVADGRDAEGKGIMVVKGKRVRIENLEFRGARVRDRNGAGIRVENGPFTVLECAFIDNENGILTGNVGTTEVAIEHSTFDGNGNAEGSAHNLYVGAIARLEVTGCLFSRSKVGHLLKSRAMSSSVRYSRLSGESGTSSYEMDFPDGGDVVVIGNLIQQGPASENSTIVSFGAEGYRWPQNILRMAFNTVINDRAGNGTFVRVSKGADRAVLLNNVWVGKGSNSIDAPFQSRGNVEAAKADFSDPSRFDYRPLAGSRLIGRAGFRGPTTATLRFPPGNTCTLHRAARWKA